jgi:hypothetical protein
MVRPSHRGDIQRGPIEDQTSKGDHRTDLLGDLPDAEERLVVSQTRAGSRATAATGG